MTPDLSYGNESVRLNWHTYVPVSDTWKCWSLAPLALANLSLGTWNDLRIFLQRSKSSHPPEDLKKSYGLVGGREKRRAKILNGMEKTNKQADVTPDLIRTEMREGRSSFFRRAKACIFCS